ncbi:MAG TPA: hypothetical protein VKT81_05365 [Bryobacteraceae bacterium]|nr:hypothetical protein [Bryobacteraceae bacterium]
MRFRLWASLLIAGSALAQPPLIYNRSIYNAASFMPLTIPGGMIAQGSIFSIFGAQLGPAKAVTASSFPLQTTLGGVSINVVQGASVLSAIPLFVSAGQINAIMPSKAPLGAASIQVVVNNAHSNMAPVQITSSAVGIFTANGTGIGPGVLYNFVAQNNQPINSTSVTAKPGQVITLYATGLGPVSGPDNVAPPSGNLPVQVQVFVGGQAATVQYSGRSSCCSGLDQIVFTVPKNAPTGCWVPVYVKTAGTTMSNFVTMAIENSPGICTTDVLPQVTSAFLKGEKLGEALVTRTTTRQDVGVLAPVEVTSDFHVDFAFQPDPGQFPFNPALAFPPGGTCTVYARQTEMLDANSLPLPGMAPTTMPLDTGSAYVLTGPNGMRTLSEGFFGARAGFLGGSISNNILPSSLFLDPGSYKLQGFGGMDVGPFSTSFTIPPPLTWTNRLTTNILSRTQPLTISWSGGDSGQSIAILGFGEDLPTNTSAVFVCMAPQGATSFTIPTDMLANLPASRTNPLQSKDIIYVLGLAGSSVKSIAAKGLDVGLTSFYSIIGKTVVWQ